MIEFGEGDLQALERLNALRAEGPSAELRKLERRFNARFGAGRRLAVYGSLAPGEANHHQVAALRGEWFSGLTVRGRLYDSGWGAARGFPGLRRSAAEGAVPVHLLVSRDLPLHWRRLDRFEGAEYRRILVPLHRGAELAEVANLYEISSMDDRGGDRAAIALLGIGRHGEVRGFHGELPAVAGEAMRATVEFYASAGYVEPWVGYLAVSAGTAVGTCGFKSPPVEPPWGRDQKGAALAALIALRGRASERRRPRAAPSARAR